MEQGDADIVGQLRAAGLIERVYDLPCRVIDDPVTGTPLIVPDLNRTS